MTYWNEYINYGNKTDAKVSDNYTNQKKQS